MVISGRVLHATTRESIEGVRVELRLGDREVSTHTRNDGTFEWRDDQSHAGQVVEISVEQEGFEPWRLSREVHAEEAELEIHLRPVGASTVTTAFSVRDPGGGPIDGAQIGLERGGAPVATAVTDASGEASITVAHEVVSGAVDYTVNRTGYADATGQADLAGDAPIEIVMRREAPAPVPWLPIAGGVGILVVVLLVAGAFDWWGGRGGGGIAVDTAVTEVAGAGTFEAAQLGAAGPLSRRGAGVLAEQGVTGVRAVPERDSNCRDAVPTIFAQGTVDVRASTLGTARPSQRLPCRGASIEVTFERPVQVVSVAFYGTSTTYLLVPYDANGRRLGSADAEGRLPRESSVAYESDRPNIARITFGAGAGPTMIRAMKWSS